MSTYLAGNFNGFGMILGLAVLLGTLWLLRRIDRAWARHEQRTTHHDNTFEHSPYGDHHDH